MSVQRPQMVAGSVVVVLDEDSKKELLKDAKHSQQFGDRCRLVFAPKQADYDRDYAPFLGQQVTLEVTSYVESGTAQVALVRLPEGLRGEQVPYVLMSLTEGASKNVDPLLAEPDDEDASAQAYLTGTIEFVPTMGNWMAERDRRLSARAAEGDTATVLDPTVATDAPKLAAEVEALSLVGGVARGPMDPRKVIGGRGHYVGCSPDERINIADYLCTDRTGAKRKGQWYEWDGEKPLVQPRMQVSRDKNGIVKTTMTERSIVGKRKAGWVFESRNSKRDGSLKFVAIMEFNPELFTRVGYFQDVEHRVADVGGIKFNLFDAPRKGNLTGVYRGEVKVRIHEYKHDKDASKSYAVPRYYVNGNMVDRGGQKPTHRVYLLSAKEQAPAGAIVLKAPGQAQIVIEKL